MLLVRSLGGGAAHGWRVVLAQPPLPPQVHPVCAGRRRYPEASLAQRLCVLARRLTSSQRIDLSQCLGRDITRMCPQGRAQ